MPLIKHPLNGVDENFLKYRKYSNYPKLIFINENISLSFCQCFLIHISLFTKLLKILSFLFIGKLFPLIYSSGFLHCQSFLYFSYWEQSYLFYLSYKPSFNIFFRLPLAMISKIMKWPCICKMVSCNC